MEIHLLSEMAMNNWAYCPATGTILILPRSANGDRPIEKIRLPEEIAASWPIRSRYPDTAAGWIQFFEERRIWSDQIRKAAAQGRYGPRIPVKAGA